MLEDEDKPTNLQPMRIANKLVRKSTTHNLQKFSFKHDMNDREMASTELAIFSLDNGDLQALDALVKSMMVRSTNMVTSGNQANGTLRLTTASICKVCGQEGRPTHIQDHIEANHVEGMSISCDFCEKAFSGRASYRKHRAKFHK